MLLAILSYGPATLLAQKKATNIAIILPFCSQKILDNPNCFDAQLGNLCREYYQGALIALDSFEKSHVSVHLSVYDTDNDSMNMLRILQKPLLKESELIIGPVLPNGNKMLSDLAKERGFYHVSPLMTFSKTRSDDPYWISANPDLPAYATFLYNYILKQTHDSANIIVVNDKSPFDNNISVKLKQIIPTSKNVKIKFVDYEKGIDMIRHLSSTLGNHIIVPSANEATLTNVLKSIKDTDDMFHMTTYGFPHWLEFKNPDFDVWERMNVSIVTPFFINYDDERVKRFIEAYRDRFYTEPTDAAFKGYDQMLLLGMQLAMNGKSFIAGMENKTYPALSTKYEFRHLKSGESYQNYYLNVIRIEDTRLKKVN
jgi:hypothetical protein